MWTAVPPPPRLRSRYCWPTDYIYGRKVPHLRCYSHTSFKVKRSKVMVRGGLRHMCPPNLTATLLVWTETWKLNWMCVEYLETTQQVAKTCWDLGMIRIWIIICLNSESSAVSVRSSYVCSVRGTEDLTFTAFHIGRQALFVTGRHEIPSVSLVAINRKNAHSPWTISPVPFHTAYVILPSTTTNRRSII